MMMRKAALWIGLFVGLGWTSGAGAVPIVVKNIATGVDDSTGLKLSYGTPDSDYIMGAGSVEGVGLIPDAFQFVATGDPSDWLSDPASSTSRWIALSVPHPESTWDQSYNPVAPGDYSFLTEVNLTGFDASTAQIENLRLSADDALVDLKINGTSLYSQLPGNNSCHITLCFHSLGTLGSGWMQAGVNVIEFRIHNGAAAANPMGLRVEGLVTAEPIPEPSTALLLGIGLIGMSARNKRRHS